MVLLSLLIFLFSIKPVFASPSVIINSTPDVVTAGTTFPITYTVTETATSSANYYYKFFGGIDTDVYKVTTSSDLSYTSSWVNFPQINTSSLSNSFTGFGFVKSDAPTGTYNLKIKIVLISNTGSGVTSPSFPLEIVAAPPTPTSTSIPTFTPTPTSIPTKTPTSTKSPTPAPTSVTDLNKYDSSESSDTSIIVEPTPSVEGVSDQISTPESKNKSKTKINFLPIILIVIGGGLLITPVIINKIKDNDKKNN